MLAASSCSGTTIEYFGGVGIISGGMVADNLRVADQPDAPSIGGAPHAGIGERAEFVFALGLQARMKLAQLIVAHSRVTHQFAGTLRQFLHNLQQPLAAQPSGNCEAEEMIGSE